MLWIARLTSWAGLHRITKFVLRLHLAVRGDLRIREET
jgi:hypothetical protein